MGFLDDGSRSTLESDFDRAFGNPQSGGSVPNVIQQLMATPAIAQGVGNVDPGQLPGPPMPSAEETRRQPRRSVLDIVGGLGDVFATVGGATPQYQPRLDAAAERARREVDQGWQDKFNTQRFRAGDQAFEAGEQQLSEQQRTLLGQAARGVSAVYARGATPEAKIAGVLKAWPMVARQLNLSPEQSAQFVQDFQADPEGTLTAMNAALNPVASQGSQPKEIQIYEMLRARDPAKAEEYLAAVATGDKGITDYQEAQLALGERRAGESERAARARESVARERLRIQREKNPAGAKAKGDPVAAAQSAQNVINEMRDAFNRLKAAGGINAKGQSAAQRAGAWAMENVPLAERATNPDAFSARQDLDRLRTQGITSLLPIMGGLQLGGKNIDAAKELDTWRKAIASASDYESAMRALNGFQTRINDIVRESSGSAPAPRSRPANAPAPRRQSPAPRRSGGTPSVSNW